MEVLFWTIMQMWRVDGDHGRMLPLKHPIQNLKTKQKYEQLRFHSLWAVAKSKQEFLADGFLPSHPTNMYDISL